VRNLRDLTDGRGVPHCQVLHPGSEDWLPMPAVLENSRLRLNVPLERGCAMVRITPA